LYVYLFALSFFVATPYSVIKQSHIQGRPSRKRQTDTSAIIVQKWPFYWKETANRTDCPAHSQGWKARILNICRNGGNTRPALKQDLMLVNVLMSLFKWTHALNPAYIMTLTCFI